MEPQHHSIPENAGERLMTAIIDDVSKSDPQRCFMSIPRSSDLKDGLRDISYAVIARAIDRCAWWMESLLGRGVDFPTIATYLNPMDFRHVILIFGAIKAGYKACPECSIRCGRGKVLTDNIRCSTALLATASRYRSRSWISLSVTSS